MELPDKSQIVSTHTTELYLPPLPPSARIAHIFPALQNTSLLSISKLCDAGCTALFSKDNVTVTHQEKVILKGNRCPHTGLWQVPLHAMPNAHKANSVIGLTNTAAELVKFSHAALFSPSLGTLKLALEKCYINNFPGLSLQTLKNPTLWQQQRDILIKSEQTNNPQNPNQPHTTRQQKKRTFSQPTWTKATSHIHVT